MNIFYIYDFKETLCCFPVTISPQFVKPWEVWVTCSRSELASCLATTLNSSCSCFWFTSARTLSFCWMMSLNVWIWRGGDTQTATTGQLHSSYCNLHGKMFQKLLR